MTTNDTSAPPTVDPLLARLRDEALQSGGGGVALIAGGIALTMFMMTWPAGFIAYLTGSSISFWICYLIALGLVVPYILRRLNAQQIVYSDDMPDISPASSYGEMNLNVARFELAMLVGWLMLGPALIVEGIMQARGLDSLTKQKMLGRCAVLLRQLASAGAARPLDSLLEGDESRDEIIKLVKYLDHRDWVGASSDFKRVWLSSKAQTELPRLGVPLGRS